MPRQSCLNMFRVVRLHDGMRGRSTMLTAIHGSPSSFAPARWSRAVEMYRLYQEVWMATYPKQVETLTLVRIMGTPQSRLPKFATR